MRAAGNKSRDIYVDSLQGLETVWIFIGARQFGHLSKAGGRRELLNDVIVAYEFRLKNV